MRWYIVTTPNGEAYKFEADDSDHAVEQFKDATGEEPCAIVDCGAREPQFIQR